MESETPHEEERRGWRSLSGEQKTAASILGLCGLAALGLAFYQTRAGLLTPFMVSNNVLDRSREFYKQQADERAKEDQLRRQDTDHDGLNDYDELNTYHTSPYLADSDSDGVSDFVEVARGTDPNCPAGQDCTGAASVTPNNATSSDVLSLPTDTSATDTTSTPSNSQPRDAAAIRADILSKHLVDPDLLRQIPDDQLVQLYTSTNQAVASSTVLPESD